MFTSGAQLRSSSSVVEDKDRKWVSVYDRRLENTGVKGTWLEISGLDFNEFLGYLQREFAIPVQDAFVLTTTDRTVLDFNIFEELQDGTTVYLLQKEDQALSVATKEHIIFTPHYDTLIQSGTYEYYASEGRLPLPYAIAELIDNALTATAENTGLRTIEIQLLFDETLGKPALIVLDNGSGMTTKKLKNWAVYRLSKFCRDNSTFASKEVGYVPPDPVPRSLNSDISYFGVGGKQAVFHIGDSARMISKPAGSPDVHELVLSKEEFERKEKDKKNVYSGIIRNRKPGDSSHVNKADEHFLHALIAEESGKENFTAVVITGISPGHITFLKQNFKVWTRQLAHVYHYYIHGVNGNNMKSSFTNADDLPKVDIQVTLREKPPRCPRVLNFTEVDDDMQTLYIKAAADTFEFQATTEQDGGTVEGVIRYHPFLYDKETYPNEPNAVQAPCDDDDDDAESGVQHQPKGKRPIFECFWNGRLIPYTTIQDFYWCTWSKDSKLPAECYNRISGVIFTDYKFNVSTTKLTFMDLELKLRNSIFTRVVKGQKQRVNIQKEFTLWLQSCHEKLDKKIKFLDYKETITRTDVPTKRMQHPWGTFSSIEWDGKVYTTSQLVKSHKTLPILYGTVIRFLLYGNYKEDIFATGGQVELALEPRALYDKNKTIPISKIDQTATVEAITKHIQNDIVKLPDKLRVDWSEGNLWPQNAVCPAGTPLGPLNVEILNKKGESLSRMPSVGQGLVKKLIIELKVIKRGAQEHQEVCSYIARHSSKWAYWFKKIENLGNLGKYTLSLNTMISDSNATVFGGRPLPSYKLNFTIKEGRPECFVPSTVSSTLQVGVPFDIPLLMKDAYDHPVMPPPNLKPVLYCSGLDLSYETVDITGTILTIRNVKARGKVLTYQPSKPYELKVTLPGMTKDTQTINVVLLPGKPHSLHVTPEDNPMTVENGSSASFKVEIHDEVGNITANPKQIVHCQIEGLPLLTTNCSSTGAGQLVTKPINVTIIKGKPLKIQVQFDMPSEKSIAMVTKELLMLPSTRVARMELYSQDDRNLVLRNEEKIEWLAGGLIENMFYRLYDEGCFEVPLTPEIASKIKVNWRAGVNLKDLVPGKLPDIQIPTRVQEERFYQVSYKDQSVSAAFYILPRPDQPTRLNATLLQSCVKLGETLPGNINLELVDEHGNETKTLTSTCVNHVSVEAEGLDISAVAFIWQERSRSIWVTRIRFNSGTPGSREMCFKYKNYVLQVFVKVTAGVPAKLKLVSEPEKPLQVLNGSCIATPFLVQLCDNWGNPSPDQRVVVYITSSSPMLKVKTSVTSQPVDSEGKASFTVNNVSGLKGYYQLEFKGIFNKIPIPGPSVNFIVLPDPNKPVSLSVEYDTEKKYPAGGKFPVFSVTVMSEDGSPITTFNPAAASMFLWQGAPVLNTPPQTASELKCSKPMENEKNDCFHFRGKEIPEHVGKYTIQFSLRIDKTRTLSSDQITINVVANEPVKLGPDSQPPTPVVSYSKAIASRMLVENMTLRITDSYGNPAGQKLHGKVMVSIKNTSEHDNKRLPLFEGKTNSFQFGLEEGKVHIARLTVMENSPGEDGSSYILIFTPDVAFVSTPLAPFQLLFHFYNDVENQRKMSALTKTKKELTIALNTYKENLNTRIQLLQLLTTQHMDACRKESEQRHALKMKNVMLQPPVSIPVVERLIQEKATEADRILMIPRRVCSIHNPFRGQNDVLGMIGHLAIVQDNDAARVICWHIRGDMDCVITNTTNAAMRIYHASEGRQQVMPLENAHLPPDRPLPHIQNGRMLFYPTGNPVYARDTLIYLKDKQNCDKVFKNFLGNTILIDDLDSANSYRQAVVQLGKPCPTILTRKGERLSAKGTFGGAHNKAPPIDRLQVFGAPCPEDYYILKEQIDMLTQYCSTLQKISEILVDRDKLSQDTNSPEMLKNQQEMTEKETQLKEVERQIGSTKVRPLKRRPDGSGEPSDIIAKMARHSTP